MAGTDIAVKEVCGAAERGGTRATASADPQGKKTGETPLEGAHLVEGRRPGPRRRLEDSTIIAARSTIAPWSTGCAALVEQGFEAALTRKPGRSPRCRRPRRGE